MKGAERILKLLSDTTRLRIIMLLSKRELCVCQIMGVLGISQPLVSRNLSLMDVDWYVEDDQNKITFDVDKEKAARNGITTDAVSQSLRIALGGMSAGLVHLEREKEQVELLLMKDKIKKMQLPEGYELA